MDHHFTTTMSSRESQSGRESETQGILEVKMYAVEQKVRGASISHFKTAYLCLLKPYCGTFHPASVFIGEKMFQLNMSLC